MVNKNINPEKDRREGSEAKSHRTKLRDYAALVVSSSFKVP